MKTVTLDTSVVDYQLNDV